MKTHVGELINEIIKSEGFVQTELATKADISLSQLNLFLNGKSHLSLKNFLSLLEILNIDIYEMLQDKIDRRQPQQARKVQTAKDCLMFLYDRLDVVRQQSTLKNLQSAVVLSNKKIPDNVKLIIKNSTQLI